MIALAITTPSAEAAATRAEYVAQVDPICLAGKDRELAAARDFGKRVRKMKKQGFDPRQPTKKSNLLTVRFYDRLARIQRDINGQISAVAPVPGDEPTVSRWIEGRRQFTATVQRAVHFYSVGKLRRFYKLIKQAFDIQDQAELFVKDFGFWHCISYK